MGVETGRIIAIVFCIVNVGISIMPPLYVVPPYPILSQADFSINFQPSLFRIEEITLPTYGHDIFSQPH